MRLEHRRCDHCRAPYNYQSTGEGCHAPLNDNKYCADCMAQIIKTLDQIPKRFKAIYRPVECLEQFKTITLEQVLEWEDRAKGRKDLNFIRGQRIWMPLFDMKDPDNNNFIREIDGMDEYQGYKFKVDTWTRNREHSIEIAIEYDLINDTYTGEVWR